MQISSLKNPFINRKELIIFLLMHSLNDINGQKIKNILFGQRVKKQSSVLISVMSVSIKSQTRPKNTNSCRTET